MLYIMRHGKTDWNKLEKLQGHVDIPLNEEGIASAREACVKYKNVPLDICFCSPLSRARTTAELFLEGRDIPVIVDDRLIEMGFGEYEGVTGYFNNPACPINDLFVNPTAYVSQGGAETFEHLNERTLSFLEDKVYPLLAQKKDVLIVGHGAMNCSLISHIKRTPLSNFWDNLIGNCELVKLVD